MAMIPDLVGPIWDIVKTISSPIGKCSKDLIDLDENMENLRQKLQLLARRKHDMESRMRTELNSGKRLKEEVDFWFSGVEEIVVDTQAMEIDVKKGKCLSRACLGKRVAKNIKKVNDLLEKDYSRESLVVDNPSSNEDLILPATTLVGKNIEIKRDEIWAYLMNDDVRNVGVWGMGGIGKTTVMKHIYNKLLKVPDKFDIVIWIDVSKPLSVFQLQKDIAERLNEDLSKCTGEKQRVVQLYSVFRKSKLRWVLILDDVVEAFSLREVGIPEPTRTNGNKLVLTTRSLDVCRHMDCIDIGMQLLFEEEAWNLFSEIVGNVLTTPNIKAIAEQVAKECARLPLAIVTIAESMKGVDDINEWSAALTELQSSTQGYTDMPKVIKQLRFSYNHLEHEKLKHCFLYCALYPEEFTIDRAELIRHLIAEGMIEETDSRKEQFETGHTMLNILERASLLENTIDDQKDAPKLVKMHDLLRKMAIQIKRTDSQFLIKAGVRREQLPDAAELWREDLEIISLMCNNASVIPSSFSPQCDKLRTLLLSRIDHLVKIPTSFFTHMRGLKVLDVSYTSIKDLPNSVSELEKLTALYLTRCTELKSVPSLKKLGLLRELDLSYTGIKEVPPGMELLANLRYLNLYKSHVEMFPVGILPKLSRLQCLLLSGKSKTLKVQREELPHLTKLESFADKFHSLHDFNTYGRSLYGHGPKNYILQLGQGEDNYSLKEENYTSKEVIVKESCSNGGQGEDFLVVPNKVKFVNVQSCHDLTSLFDISSSSSSTCSPLECLETLELNNLQKLRFLFRGEGSTLPPGVFSCLKELSIQRCPNIKKLFASGWLLRLHNLEQITVFDCEQMEEIKAEAEDEVGKGEASGSSSSTRYNSYFLPKLKAVSLTKLPALKSIFKGTVISPCLENLTVSQCPKLKKLPLFFPMSSEQPVAPPKLQMILDERWWEELEWDHPHAKNVLRGLCKFL